MIAKSSGRKNHVTNLRKWFKRLNRYKLRFNPAKCTFGVTSVKLLGFIVSQFQGDPVRLHRHGKKFEVFLVEWNFIFSFLRRFLRKGRRFPISTRLSSLFYDKLKKAFLFYIRNRQRKFLSLAHGGGKSGSSRLIQRTSWFHGVRS